MNTAKKQESNSGFKPKLFHFMEQEQRRMRAACRAACAFMVTYGKGVKTRNPYPRIISDSNVRWYGLDEY